MYLVARYGDYWGYVYSFAIAAICIAASVGYFYFAFERKQLFWQANKTCSLKKQEGAV
jgi:hypothetical protein